MSFVSYAQNFEDVMLWRALKHVQNGVYVDVGAQHPVVDSVSKAFYEHGWRGIHIEPVPEYAELLRQDRPDETVLQVALADTEGTLEFNVIPGTGLSTVEDAYAQRHQTERGFDRQRIQVPVLTLKSALRSLVGKEVHWLKIDVEGFEEKVLKGWDSQTLRPWVMVVEATIPGSPETDYAGWDPILTAAGYQFVYFDGLNRFYVAKEHAELAEAFSSPPNVFDGVQLSGLASSELCHGLVASHQARERELVTQAEASAQWLQNEWDAANQKAEKLAAELNGVNEHNAHLQAHIQWLQNEWDAANQKANKLAAELNGVNEQNTRLQAHNQWLQNEWDAANQKAEKLATRLQAHNQWLQNEWDAAKRELHDVYTSKSWLITRPLRQAVRIAKLIVLLPRRIVHWMLRLIKQMVKPLVLWVMRKTLSNYCLKASAKTVLTNQPRLVQRLREFAARSGLIIGEDMVASMRYADNDDTAIRSADSDDTTPLVKNLSPRATRIYADLQKAIKAGKN